MEKFIRHTGIGAPLRRSAVDTDQIIPAVYLKRITRTGFDDALFASWRASEADFILNQDAYKRASVLVAGPDFGTGSSREHAVWALKDYGFKAVLAPRFADIFRGNAGKQGLVAGVISQEDAEQLWKILEAEPGTEVTVDLERRTVEAGSFRTVFQIDDYVRWTLMEGLDDISLTLTQEDAIRAYEEARPTYKPRSLPARHEPDARVVPARSAEMPVPIGYPFVRPGA
ncbi:3-isopropylmalate dehydratase small subunit [Actinomyces qiguomingii]|uniref:3-isopropylmalate dehydratase small subunit n=1 Tax=Actinomyces qiguomingii TaxID=2057800 RepID=UPI000CA036BD|nr:3-isopropylmalate dehydratase small subunit [Actinomyces qiguomingii]